MSEYTAAPVKEKPARSYPRPRPPFKLNFVLSQEPGHSYISPSRPQRLAPVLCPKFFSKNASQLVEEGELRADLKEIDEVYKAGPKEKYKEVVLESHRYGWYAEPLISTDKSDRRLNFPIETSDMVKIHSEIKLCQF